MTAGSNWIKTGPGARALQSRRWFQPAYDMRVEAGLVEVTTYGIRGFLPLGIVTFLVAAQAAIAPYVLPALARAQPGSPLFSNLNAAFQPLAGDVGLLLGSCFFGVLGAGAVYLARQRAHLILETAGPARLRVSGLLFSSETEVPRTRIRGLEPNRTLDRPFEYLLGGRVYLRLPDDGELPVFWCGAVSEVQDWLYDDLQRISRHFVELAESPS